MELPITLLPKREATIIFKGFPSGNSVKITRNGRRFISNVEEETYIPPNDFYPFYSKEQSRIGANKFLQGIEQLVIKANKGAFKKLKISSIHNYRVEFKREEQKEFIN